MREVMEPTLAPITTALAEARTLHTPCFAAIAEASKGIPLGAIPGCPVVFDRATRTFRRLYVATVQIRMAEFRSDHAGEGNAGSYRVTDAYLPPPVTLGVLWGKPHIRLTPLAGTTPADWQTHFPPLHYMESTAGQHDICIGDGFAIGDAGSPDTQLPKLTELLGWANFTNSYYPLSDVATRYPNGVWPAWARACTALAHGEPQDVFIRIPRLTLHLE